MLRFGAVLEPSSAGDTMNVDAFDAQTSADNKSLSNWQDQSSQPRSYR